MITCNSPNCQYCFKDHHKNLVCNGSPMFVRNSMDTHPDILTCKGFKLRVDSNIPELQPGRGRDGLFPGQIKPTENQ